jgi:hypothetical protein
VFFFIRDAVFILKSAGGDAKKLEKRYAALNFRTAFIKRAQAAFKMRPANSGA